jgi:tetratricopeptide (TPR) repeat protein
LWFLRTALEYDPKDPDVNRECAVALRSKRQFDQAIACWHRVEQARPGNEEAARAIASLSVEKTIVEGKYGDEGGGGKAAARGARGGDTVELTPEQRLERDIRRNPKDLAKYKELSELYIREEVFSKAAEVLARAVEVSGGDLDLRERLEDAQMRHLRQQLVKVEKQYQQTGREEDKRRYDEARRQVLQKDLEMCKKRVERYPNNLGFKFDLGQRYQATGKYNEAIAEYQAARSDPRRKGVCLLALGECFQKIKQHPLALKHYEEAVQEIPERDAENRKKALYRAGKLAVIMRNIDLGDQYLTTLAGLDFNYKDVSDLLDKVAEIRKILSAKQATQSAAEQEAEEEGGPQEATAEPA